VHNQAALPGVDMVEHPNGDIGASAAKSEEKAVTPSAVGPGHYDHASRK
jgi:hypothetical protein